MNRKSTASDTGPKPTGDVLLEYFGFHTMPFSRTIAVDHLLPLNGQAEMQARLRQAMRESAIALVTGLGGCGKSTALRSFVGQFDTNRVLLLYIPNPAPGLTGVYRDILKTLGYEPTYFRPQLVSQVRIALQEVAAKGKQAVILFDEAHRLTDVWLEDLRMLLSIDMDAASLATLILVGHPNCEPDFEWPLTMRCGAASTFDINSSRSTCKRQRPTSHTTSRPRAIGAMPSSLTASSPRPSSTPAVCRAASTRYAPIRYWPPKLQAPKSSTRPSSSELSSTWTRTCRRYNGQLHGRTRRP